MTHLTEEERQSVADGTLAPEVATRVSAHLSACEACASDVGAIRALLARVHATPIAPMIDDDWSAIHSRIVERKPMRPSARARRVLVAGLAIAAVFAGVVIIAHERATPGAAPAAVTLTPAQLAAVEDSTAAAQAEIDDLMSNLELQRALMPAGTSAAIDHELAVCDSAITELRIAVQRDPRNPVLRQLLASSYERKIEVLKKVDNAS